MVTLSTLNPACYAPTALTRYLPSAIACAPPPSYFASAYNAVTSPFSSTYTVLSRTLQALVGLPFLSLLLIPTTGSWSTTINFFFFYLTWSTLILSNTPLRVELIATLSVRTIFYILPSLAFLSFDAALPGFAESFKALQSSALPLKNASRKKTFRLGRILAWSILNILLSIILQTSIELLLTKVLFFRSALRVSHSLPSPITIVKNLALGFLSREVLTYVIHRYTLHESDGLPARLHNSWYHTDIVAPYPLSGSYDHPIPYLLHKFLPMYLPAALFRFHLLTYILYLTIVSLEETFAYSGYSSVPGNFILGGIARRTDNHCVAGEEGNFGCFGLVDWVMGTSIGADLGDDMMDEAEKHDVQGKAKRGAKKVNGKAKKGLRRRGSVEGEVDD